jgi:hypothetical protein
VVAAGVELAVSGLVWGEVEVEGLPIGYMKFPRTKITYQV